MVNKSPIVSLLSNALKIGTGWSNMSMNGSSGFVYFCTLVTMSPTKLCMKLSASSEKFFSVTVGGLHRIVRRVDSPIELKLREERWD